MVQRCQNSHSRFTQARWPIASAKGDGSYSWPRYTSRSDWMRSSLIGANCLRSSRREQAKSASALRCAPGLQTLPQLGAPAGEHLHVTRGLRLQSTAFPVRIEVDGERLLHPAVDDLDDRAQRRVVQLVETGITDDAGDQLSIDGREIGRAQ